MSSTFSFHLKKLATVFLTYSLWLFHVINYGCLISFMMLDHNSSLLWGNKVQVLQRESISSINLSTITCLAEGFLKNPEKYVASITEFCKDFESSKTLFFLVLMQSFLMQKDSTCLFFPPLIGNAIIRLFFIQVKF